MFWTLQFTLHEWKSSESLEFIGPSWSDFSLASVLFGLYECVCNNSLKPYHGEISRPCYSTGHYRSTTCITSSLLISQSGCWGAQQESCCVNSISVYLRGFKRQCLCMWANCICVCRLFLLLSRCCRLVSASTNVCERAHAQRTWCWRVSVHARRMTFCEMWQRENKHLTHNWSAM